MSLGAQFLIKLHTDSTNTIVFDSLKVTSFTHDGSFNGNSGTGSITTVKIEDYPGLHHDSYDVQIAYAQGSIPAYSNTLTTIIGYAEAAILAIIAAGPISEGGGGPTVPPTTI